MEPLAPADPRTAGEFRLSARLGLGGMGQVFLGYSPAGRAVAVKMCHPELAADPTFVERFAREATAAQAVNGLYTAQVIAAGPYDKPPWLATAYVPGPSLTDYVEGYGPLPEAAAWRLAAGLAEALAAVHACGLVHRDLKPSNVLLAVDGPRVIDFGIASALEAGGLEGGGLTTAGTIIGSPPYMSPEQAMGEPTGPASDVFALGATLCFAAAGAPPFGDGDAPTVLFRVVHTAPVLDRLPPGLRPLAEACLAKDAASRPTLPQVLRACQDATAGYGGSAGSFWPGQMTAVITGYGSPGGGRAYAPTQAATPGSPVGTTAPGGGAGIAGPGVTRLDQDRGGVLGRRRLLAGLGGVVVAGGLAAAGWELTRPGPVKPAPAAVPGAGSRVAWSHKTGGPVRSAPVLSPDGTTLYVGSDDGTVYVLDAATGQLNGKLTVGGTVSGVALSGTTLVAGTAGGTVHAFDTDTLAESWSYPAGGGIAGAPTVGNGHVYAGSADGYLYALDFTSGKRTWRASTGKAAQPGVPEAIGQVWAASQDGSVYVFKASDGKTAAKPFPVGGAATSVPVEFTAAVYVGSANGLLSSLSFDSFTPGSGITAAWQFPAGGTIVGRPTVTGGAVYTATTDGTAYALSVTSALDKKGNELSRIRLGGPVRSGPVTHDGLVYFGCDDGYLYAVDFSQGTRGSVSWRYRTGGAIAADLVTGNGLIYLGSHDRTVYAVRA